MSTATMVYRSGLIKCILLICIEYEDIEEQAFKFNEINLGISLNYLKYLNLSLFYFLKL